MTYDDWDDDARRWHLGMSDGSVVDIVTAYGIETAVQRAKDARPGLKVVDVTSEPLRERDPIAPDGR